MIHQFRKMIEIDLPVKDENPDVNPPTNPVIKTSNSGELFLSTIMEILPASIWSLLMLIIKLMSDHTIKEPRNAESNALILFWSIRIPGKKPAIPTDHHGKNRPKV